MTKPILNHPFVKLFFVVILAAGLIVGVVLPLAPAVHANGSVIEVNKFLDDEYGGGPFCTLREAVRAANSGSLFGACDGTGATVIYLEAGTYELTRIGSKEDNNATGDLDITGTLTISGAGAGSTIIDASGLITDRVLDIHSGAVVKISGVTIINGQTPDGDAGGNGEAGGGIRNSGSLTITNSAITSNTTGAGGSGGGNGGNGGGIYNDNSMTIINSTISHNTTGDGDDAGGGSGGNGGGINNSSGDTLIINNSTVSSNTTGAGGSGAMGGSGGWGGGLSNQGALTLANSTVSHNSTGANGSIGAISGGGGIIIWAGTLNSTNNTIANNQTGERGGGIAVAANSQMTNTILAGNTATTGPDCFDSGGNLTSQDFNLVEDVSSGNCIFGGPNDLTSQDPQLSPLADNGGETKTHALQAGSPAIDAADCSGSGLSTDQRGKFRPVDTPLVANAGSDGCDIGAYEAQPEFSLHKTASSLNPQAGDQLNYIIVITNSGLLSATGAVISDPLDTNLALTGSVTIDPEQDIITAPSITIKDITITPGLRITITIPVVISSSVISGTKITNTVTLTSLEIITPITPGRGGISVITVSSTTGPGGDNYLPLILKDS